MMKNKRKPHFLEVFLPNLSANRLKVPSKFVEHLEDRTSESLSLIGPSGNIWHVNLLEYNGHLFFHDGWSNFVKDHFLQCGDTLIFGYNGNANFTVQIFDESSCEKEEAFNANCSRGVSECTENSGKKRERVEEVSKLTLVSEKKMKGSWDSWDWEPIHQDLSAGSSEQELNLLVEEVEELKETLTSGCTTKNIVKASDTTVVLAIPAQTESQRMSSLVKHHVRKTASILKKACKKKPNKQTKPYKKTKPKTDPQTTSNLSKLLESSAARYFTSNFPYFVRVMCHSNISGNGTMKIPMHFSTVHLPNFKFKVTLMNLNGERWMVNTIPSVRRRSTMLSFCGGWLAFVRGNNIKKEDVCIFELVSKYEMRVRVLRLGMEGLDCQIGSSIVDVDGFESGEKCLDIVEYAGAHPSEGFDDKNEPCTHLIGNHENITDVMPYMQQEAESLIELGDDPIAVLGPACASASSNAIGDDTTADELVACNAEGTNSYQRSRNNQNHVQARHTMNMKPTLEIARDALSFTSPFPCFMKVMTSSNVGGKFSINVPNKFSAAHLPCYTTELVLHNVKGDSWNVVAGRYGQQTKFCRGWMSFARMNNVKIGDTCIFELVDEKVFQVRVFENSHEEQKCVNYEAVADDSTASIESTQCGVLPET